MQVLLADVSSCFYSHRMSGKGLNIEGYRIEPLSPQTWDEFASLAERHNGVWGGCWCTWFHLYPDPPERKALGNREFKRRLVEDDRAHAALVYDGDQAIAWAQYGRVPELANIHHRKEWEQGWCISRTIGSPASLWTATTGARGWLR
jgi:hypothetical protein